MPEYFQICPNNFHAGEGGGCPLFSYVYGI